MPDSTLDPAVLSLMTDNTRGMTHINASANGGDKSGLGRKATENIARQIIENGGRAGNPASSSSVVGMDDIKANAGDYRPMAMTPEILAQMKEEADAVGMDVLPPEAPTPVPNVAKPVAPPIPNDDKDQLEFDFERFINAEDVHIILTDLMNCVKYLRKEVRELKEKYEENN
tara:strand:- start:1200 stop:1715 length:516 start_codon:yes stop_codon:yes gene_type:complete